MKRYIPCDYTSRVAVKSEPEIVIVPVSSPVCCYSRELVYDSGYSLRLMVCTPRIRDRHRNVKKIFASYNDGIPDYTLIYQPVLFTETGSHIVSQGFQYISCDVKERTYNSYKSITEELVKPLHILFGKPLMIYQIQYKKVPVITKIIKKEDV